MSDEILVAKRNGVLSITLNRPHKKNALTGAMYEAMIAGLDEAEADEGIAAVLVKGSGGMFTAGNDIGDFLAAAQGGAHDMPAFRFIRRLAGYGKPIIAAIEGLAIGIGATLCPHCDFVYAAPGAQFAMPFVKLGILPEGASSLLIPQKFGARAGEMLLLGEPFSAESAAAMGFVTAIVPADKLYAHAQEKGEALARQPRKSLLAARALMRGDRAEVLARIDEEGRQIQTLLASPEAIAAFKAFMARFRFLRAPFGPGQNPLAVLVVEAAPHHIAPGARRHLHRQHRGRVARADDIGPGHGQRKPGGVARDDVLRVRLIDQPPVDVGIARESRDIRQDHHREQKQRGEQDEPRRALQPLDERPPGLVAQAQPIVVGQRERPDQRHHQNDDQREPPGNPQQRPP